MKSDGTYKTSILTYNITKKEKENIFNGMPVDLTNKINSRVIIDAQLISNIFNKAGDCEGYILQEWCTSGTHPDENGFNDCKPEYYNSDRIYFGCGYPGSPVNNGSPFNPSPGGPVGPGTSGGGGGTSDDDDVSVPTGPCVMPGSNCIEDVDPVHDKNCEELGKLMNNPATTAPQNNPNIIGNHKSTRIAILNCASQLGSNFEHGYGFYNKNNFPQYGPYAHNIPAAEDNHVHFPGNSVQYGTVHSHPDNGVRIPMFSHDDLYSLLQIKNQYGIGSMTPDFGDATFVCVLVVSQGAQTYTYAIKIEDPIKLLNLNDYKTTNKKWKRFGDIIRNKYIDDANGVNGSATEYQKAFLNLVKDLDLGISLYKMKPNDLSNPNELETWEKLSLNSNGTLANSIPCN